MDTPGLRRGPGFRGTRVENSLWAQGCITYILFSPSSGIAVSKGSLTADWVVALVICLVFAAAALLRLDALDGLEQVAYDLGVRASERTPSDRIAVIAIDDQDRVALVGQHRYAYDAYYWEIPEGGSPLEEDSLEGAKRELLEETGLTARTWREIGRWELSNSVTDEAAVAYVATDLVHGEAEPDPEEQLEFPVLYANAKAGTCRLEPDGEHDPDGRA